MPRLTLPPALSRFSLADEVKRVLVAFAAIILLAGGILAAYIASLDLGAMERAVVARIEAETGARLIMRQSRQAYWPQPRVVMEGVRIQSARHNFSVDAPRIVIALNIFDMLNGAIEEPTLIFQDAEFRITTPPLEQQARSPRSMMQLVAQLADMFEGRERLDRLRILIENSRLILSQGMNGEDELTISPLEARMRYARRTGRIDVFMRRNSDIRPLEFTFSLPARPLLANGANAPASLALSGYGSRLSFNGRMRMDPAPSLIGEASGVLHPALAVALGLVEDHPRPESREVINLAATASLDPRGIGLEELRIAQAGKMMNGIAALREHAGRWSLSSTLAGNLVDGSAAHAAIARLKDGESGWSRKALELNPLPKLDLDVRLSTREFRIGGLDLTDVALSIFTRAGRAEFSIAEGSFGKGTIKARISLTQRAEGANPEAEKGENHEIRLLVSGDRLEAGSFLDRAFGFSRINGKGSFVFQAESRGANAAQVVANLSGSAAFDIRDGEITGIDLERLAVRSAALPPQAALYAAIGGRTPFESLSASFTILNGKVEPAGSSFVSTNVESQMDGIVDLPGARHELAIILKRRRAIAGSESEFFAFRIEGSLMAPLLRPDMTLLPNRS